MHDVSEGSAVTLFACEIRGLTRNFVAWLMAQQLVLSPVYLRQASCDLLWQLEVPAARALWLSLILS